MYRVSHPSAYYSDIMRVAAEVSIEMVDTIYAGYAPWAKWFKCRIATAMRGDATDAELMVRLTAINATPKARLIAIEFDRA